MPKQKRMRRTPARLPGEYTRGPSTVQVPIPMEQGTYVLKLRRLDGEWSLSLQWMRMDRATRQLDAGALDLPHEVLTRLFSMKDGIITSARSERGRLQAEERKRGGFIPFQRKEAVGDPLSLVEPEKLFDRD